MNVNQEKRFALKTYFLGLGDSQICYLAKVKFTL